MTKETLKQGRRSFLKASALTSATAFTGTMIAPKKAYANNWGQVDSSLYDRPPVKILEINLIGAPSTWETLWVRKNGSVPDYSGMESQMQKVVFKCPNAGNTGPDTPLFNELSPTALGTSGTDSVFLGPAAKPIWHLMNRMRMVTMGHDDTPVEIHEVALPYGLTGTNPGNGRHSGPGVPIARRSRILKPNQLTPHAYVINTGYNLTTPYFDGASMAVGMHSGADRPLFLRMETLALLNNRLDRDNTSAQRDDLLRALNGQYKDQLMFHGNANQMVRSQNYDEYDAALSALFNAPSLKNLLPHTTTGPTSAYWVAQETGDPDDDHTDPVRAAINLAASLLTHPTDSPSHVLVADVGRRNLGNNQPSYDTHGDLITSDYEAVQVPLSNLYSLFSALNDVIDPNGQDSSKLNLDEVMIVLSTEFGREATPEIRPNGRTGREHNAVGYLNMMIGGPFNSTDDRTAGWLENTGRGLPKDDWYTPADFRAAVLLAAGIDPFSPEIFGTNDCGPTILAAGGTEDSNTVAIANQILAV
jgi:hypothetical protein